MTAPSLELARLRSPRVAGRDTVLLVPVGSVEQHGPHLPLGTDTLVADAVCRAVARSAGERAGGLRVLVAPSVAYGASGEHEGFPGTVSVGHEALALVLLELGRSAARWARHLVLVNAHGGNAPTVQGAVERLRAEGRSAAWWQCAVPGGDAHAGRTETSLVSALAPSTVRRDLAQAGETAPVETLMGRLRAGGVAAVSPGGVLGDPSGAHPEEGERLLALMARPLADVLAGLPVDGSAALVAVDVSGLPQPRLDPATPTTGPRPRG